MRKIVQILCILLPVSVESIAQVNDSVEIAKFYTDSSLNANLNLLTKFDSTDLFSLLDCESASELVGDIYFSHSDYLKAVAYYDSADSKYRNRGVFCGNGYYIYFIPRRFKVSQCYSAEKNIKQAIAALTPYIFDNFGSQYFDSSMTTYYLANLNLLYSKQEIQNELRNSLDNMKYSTYYRWTRDSSAKYINVNCEIKLFDSELELAGFETSLEKDGHIPIPVTKEFFVEQFRQLNVYKRLQNWDGYAYNMGLQQVGADGRAMVSKSSFSISYGATVF
jgi:tetratricopeptide (TPR) repeat protein